VRILIITSWYPTAQIPHGGIFVKEQALALSNEHEVTLVACDVDYSTGTSFFQSRLWQSDENRFEEFFLMVGRSIPFYNQLNFLLTASHKIGTLVKKRQFDIIHAHVSYPAGVIARRISKETGLPYIITEHASPFESLFRSFFHKYLLIKSLNQADLVLTVSSSSAANIRPYLNRDVRVMPNLLSDEKIREKAVKQTTEFRIGFLGGLNTDQKGLDILLIAFSKLSNKTGLKLLIGGDGLLLKHYQNMSQTLDIEEYCSFLGNIYPDQVQDFMQKLDLFILPSRHETFGIVAVEAMACGVPVIATKCGGPEDFMGQNNGILIPPANPDALHDAMLSVISNKTTFEPSVIRANVIDRFGTARFLEQLNKYYFSITKADAD
jgi:L-malate glycosyltransferase